MRPAYMTATSSQTWWTMARSWVTSNRARPGPEVLQQREHLVLDRDVEGGRRLVCQQQPRFAGDGRGDDHPLALAPGQLVGVGPGRALDVGQVHQLHQGLGLLEGSSRARAAVGPHGLGDLVAHPHDGVERRQGVLPDSPDVLAAHFAQLALLQADELGALHLDAPAVQAQPWRQQPEHRPQHRRLARPRLADQPEHLAGGQVEVDVLHHQGPAVPAVRAHRQGTDLEQLGAGHDLRSSADSPSPMSERAKPVSTTARPGAVASRGWTLKNSEPDCIIAPHSGVGGWTPRPR